MNKADRYVKTRLNHPDIGAREAARMVGYSHGVPSPTARRLYDAAVRLQDAPDGAKWITEQRKRMEQKLSDLLLLERAHHLL